MASNIGSSVYQTSDLIHDFACSPCQDDGLNNKAQCLCDVCKHYYCNNCVKLHNKLFKKHSVLGRQDVSKWVGYVGLSPIETCDQHDDKRLELLCEDHDELCCPICVSLTHRMCQSIVHIPHLANKLKKQADFKKLPTEVKEITKALRVMNDHLTQQKQSNTDSGTKILADINSLRKKMNDQFDEIEKKTKGILHDKLHETDDFLQQDIGKSTVMQDQLNTYLEAIQSKQDDTTSYIAYKKCKDKMREADSMIQALHNKPVKTLTFQSDPMIQQFLTGLNTLGDIFNEKHVLEVKNTSHYTIKMHDDTEKFTISGICELPGGNILITDYDNYQVKLLSSKYQVTASCYLPFSPHHICHIRGSETAVTLRNKCVNQINLVGSTLNTMSQINLKHECLGISHHNGNLYVGSPTAIYKYTMPLTGQNGKQIYEDTTAHVTVDRFTVSTDGTKIYIPANRQNKLITIDTSGNILSTLQDPDFNCLTSVCVSDLGHVFVCSKVSSTVIQVDTEGKHKLSTLATCADGLSRPWAIWFTRQTHHLIVGGTSTEITVLELK